MSALSRSSMLQGAVIDVEPTAAAHPSRRQELRILMRLSQLALADVVPQRKRMLSSSLQQLPFSLSLPLAFSATAIKLELENRNAAAEKIA